MALCAVTSMSTSLLCCSKAPVKLGSWMLPLRLQCFPLIKPFSPSKSFIRNLMGGQVPHKSLPCLTLAGEFGILAITLLSAQPATAAEGNAVRSLVDEFLALAAQEPKNALSLPTWVIHVGSVVEWVTAMALVWEYGQIPGNTRWKGLSWGMLPLLGGAMCACTWHFFYNAESLEVLVVFQAALTVIGNFTMWLAAFRIYQYTKGSSKAL